MNTAHTAHIVVTDLGGREHNYYAFASKIAEGVLTLTTDEGVDSVSIVVWPLTSIRSYSAILPKVAPVEEDPF